MKKFTKVIKFIFLPILVVLIAFFISREYLFDIPFRITGCEYKTIRAGNTGFYTLTTDIDFNELSNRVKNQPNYQVYQQGTTALQIIATSQKTKYIFRFNKNFVNGKTFVQYEVDHPWPYSEWPHCTTPRYPVRNDAKKTIEGMGLSPELTSELINKIQMTNVYKGLLDGGL